MSDLGGLGVGSWVVAMVEEKAEMAMEDVSVSGEISFGVFEELLSRFILACYHHHHRIGGEIGWG